MVKANKCLLIFLFTGITLSILFLIFKWDIESHFIDDLGK
jgi:hypothetical protein